MDKKLCPIQIIEEDIRRGGHKNHRWITLLKDIDFENMMYNNVHAYYPSYDGHKGTKVDMSFFYNLFKNERARCFTDKALIAPYDIIRNPTMEELLELSQAAKAVGIKINLKTGECIDNVTFIK